MPRSSLHRRSLLAGSTALLASSSLARAQGANGVALVIGNSKYLWEAQLGNVRRDAPDVAKAFQAMGLKTELVQDANRDALQQAVGRFKAAASGANVAAFYYAGHGASWDKDTYLVPVDADLSSPNAVKALLPVRDVTAAMKVAAHRLLVFDNCRNNPADGWRQLASERTAASFQDRAQADSDPNSLTIYSTAPGRVALDGPPGQNSPFAAAFLNQLAAGSVELTALPARLRRALLIATEGRQVVWDSNTFTAGFTLAGGKAFAPVPAAGDPSRAVEVPNAYAVARKYNLDLPPGLVAYRAGANAQKAGSYEYSIQTPKGATPYLLIVLSVDDQGLAQLVGVVDNDVGRHWRFLSGQVSGNRLSFQPAFGKPTYMIDWSDANSGSVAQVALDGGKGAGRGTYNTKFKRLDG
jgi:hypothetical protein